MHSEIPSPVIQPIQENYIFWDWNGTLLEDTRLCIDAMNRMLSKRDMPLLDTNRYIELFGFPVIEYYRKIGFNFQKESFENLSAEFVSLYMEGLHSVDLKNGARKVLEKFLEEGKRNILLSASQKDMLLQAVTEKGIRHLFTDILGIHNIYAHGKSTLALEYIENHQLDPADIIIIGDTLHDFEVAKTTGSRCILIADGHQSADRLITSGVPVLSTLLELMPVVPS